MKPTSKPIGIRFHLQRPESEVELDNPEAISFINKKIAKPNTKPIGKINARSDSISIKLLLLLDKKCQNKHENYRKNKYTIKFHLMRRGSEIEPRNG